MQAATLLCIQAHANRLANQRLLTALALLPAAEWVAIRPSYFKSLPATLNHLLMVDQYYIGALCGEANLSTHWDRYVPAPDLQTLLAAQTASDQRLIVYCRTLDAAACDRLVALPRNAGAVQREAAAHVLQHLFMHQTHHRGQVHDMLSATAVAPPQLDEFLMPSEAHFRVADMAALGWHETAVYGAPAPPREPNPPEGG
jgi:uncharacterized damage-inducible protein DinB